MGQKTPNDLTYMHIGVGFTACKNRLVVSWKGNVFKPSNLLVGLLFCHLVNQQKGVQAYNYCAFIFVQRVGSIVHAAELVGAENYWHHLDF